MPLYTEQGPAIQLADMRYQTRASLDRQKELSMWSMVMLRLTLLGDIGLHAQARGDAIGDLASLPEEAAAEASTSYRKLRRWVAGHAVPTLERVLPRARYMQLYEELHVEPS